MSFGWGPPWRGGKLFAIGFMESPTGQKAVNGYEVKGRATTGDAEVSANEWAKACNVREGYSV